MSKVEFTYNLLTLCLTLLFSFYLIFNKLNERSGNIFISFFILYLGLESLDTILVQSSFYLKNPNFYLLIPNLGLLVYPAFYFYIKFIAFKGVKLKWADLLHAIPYIIIGAITIIEYYLKPEDVQFKIMTNRGDMPWFISSIYYVLRIQGVIYMILSIKIALRFKKIIEENYSTINKRNYIWILQLTIVFIYFTLSTLIFNINRFSLNLLSNDTTFYISASISFAFIIWIIFKTLSQPYLFNGVDANIKLLKEYLAEKEKNNKPSNTAEDKIQNLVLKSKLEKYVTAHEVYLNPSLTIFDLAKGIGLTSTDLSLFLNKHLHKNFFDFINEYRIEKAKSILKDPDKRHLTILEILYDVGFNSKSSFNTAFKRYVGKTPTEYRKVTEN